MVKGRLGLASRPFPEGRLAPDSQQTEACAPHLAGGREGQPIFGLPITVWLWASPCLSLGLTVL